MKTYSITDTGILREMNQDYFFASDEPVGNLPNLYIVADGMGGHKAGDYASRYTTQRIVASVSRSSGEEPVTILKEAITTANRLLITEAAEDEAKKGMGTTLVAATIIDGRLYVANVGDSRLYIIGTDGIRQITRDHSLVAEMVRIGEPAALGIPGTLFQRFDLCLRQLGIFLAAHLFQPLGAHLLGQRPLPGQKRIVSLGNAVQLARFCFDLPGQRSFL